MNPETYEREALAADLEVAAKTTQALARQLTTALAAEMAIVLVHRANLLLQQAAGIVRCSTRPDQEGPA